MIDRMERIAKLLNREISVILQGDIDDPRVQDVTITRVEITRDLRLARVFYVVPEDVEKEDAEETEKALKKHARFIRGELAGKVSLKYMPRFSGSER